VAERPIGRLARIQVQREPLKTSGVGYDPGPILDVDRAAIGPLGIAGSHEGAWVLDVHHAAHPRVRGGGNRALSIGFAGHYRRISERFGSTPFGCGGENLIVDSDARVHLADLGETIVIRGADGDLMLRSPRVAAPCAEFTSFLKGLDVVLPQRDQADDVSFLDDGMRGYILGVDHLEASHLVAVGDEVLLVG
jgi:MOSC domain-containing protein YiiM